MQIICAWCKVTLVVSNDAGEDVSHGICPTCFTALVEEVPANIIRRVAANQEAIMETRYTITEAVHARPLS